MTPELRRFKAAIALEGLTVAEYARRNQKKRQSIYRALSTVDFSRSLREKLLKYTNRTLAKRSAK